MKVGPGIDVINEFKIALKKSSRLYFGLYHSFFEWFNPLYVMDKENNFTTRNFFKVLLPGATLAWVRRVRPDPSVFRERFLNPSNIWIFNRNSQFLPWNLLIIKSLKLS